MTAAIDAQPDSPHAVAVFDGLSHVPTNDSTSLASDPHALMQWVEAELLRLEALAFDPDGDPGEPS
mgnify:CR=1 FL=1